MVFGLLAMLMPVLAGASVITAVGLLVLGVGAVRTAWAFRAENLRRGLVTFAVGGLTFLCGVALVANPLFASGILTVVLAIYFLADGLSEISYGLRLRPRRGWGFVLCAGIVSVLLGLMIWGQFPLSGLWAIGILLGVKLCFIGLITITAGTALREAEQP